MKESIRLHPIRLRSTFGLGRRLAVCALFLTSCAPALRMSPPQQVQAWVVYFDADRGLAELQNHGALFDRVSLFAYELDPEGAPIPAPNVEDMILPFLTLAGEKGFSPWITVVNDVRYSPDSATAKDSDLIHELISDSTLRDSHARALAQRVWNDGFHGLHLDYERVPESDLSDFRAFLSTLREELTYRGLDLEVVIEPARGPLPAPNSANITVMAYDLFGPHSGPGPRATPSFVTGLGPRASFDSEDAPTLAVAVGGFAWEPNGMVRPMDWANAHSSATAASSRQRDSTNHVPNAVLEDGTVLWFEDQESLRSKWSAAWDTGFRRLIIWRLGGNDERLFSLLREFQQARRLR